MSAAIRSLVMPVSDIDAAKKVYGAVLGGPHTDTPSYVGFNVGAVEREAPRQVAPGVRVVVLADAASNPIGLRGA